MLVEKPWGYEHIWARTDKYVGKLLHINPNSRLSLQYHNHRSEHWTIVQGEGKVIVDGNHPWAGERVVFKATITAVRDAGQEEVAHGHVHGAGGHHH